MTRPSSLLQALPEVREILATQAAEATDPAISTALHTD